MDETHEPENELEQPEPEDSFADLAEEDTGEIIEDAADLDTEAVMDEADNAISEVADLADDSLDAVDVTVADDTQDGTGENFGDESDAEAEDDWVEESDEEPDEIEPEPDEDDDFGIPLPDTDFDVVGALASVSALSDVMAEEEALRSQEMAQVEAQRQAVAERAERRTSYIFPRPGVVAVERGRMASFIPALLLIAIGAYLTFLTTSSTDTSLDTGLLLAGAGVILGVLMMVYWLASGRWHYGSLFGGLSLILSVGVLAWLAQNDDPGAQGWPLVVSAIGVAAILSAILSAQRHGIQVFAGLLLILAGVVGMIVTTEALGEDITDIAETAGPMILVVIAVLVTIPGLLRWRRG